MIYYYDEDKDIANFERKHPPLYFLCEIHSRIIHKKNMTEKISYLKLIYIFAPPF